MNSLPLIFISHITEEKLLALSLKDKLAEVFSKDVTVFVSVDGSSIQIGKKWLDEIENALRGCAIELILCSRRSIKREWIMFEAGAAWLQNSLVVPICHSGLRTGELP